MSKDRKFSKSRKKIIYKILFITLTVFLVAFGSFYFIKFNQINDKYKELTMSQEEKNDRTIKQVSKLMELPKNEKPIIFEVEDKNKLGSAKVTKTFFESTKNEDVILAYEKANLSVVFRSSENRIIKTDNFTNFYAAANPIKIAIVASNSQQQDTENLINSKVINADIISKQEPKTAHAQSIVVDATGQNTRAAKELADKIGFVVGDFPAGETKPEGALLIVILATNSNPVPSN